MTSVRYGYPCSVCIWCINRFALVAKCVIYYMVVFFESGQNKFLSGRTQINIWVAIKVVFGWGQNNYHITVLGIYRGRGHKSAGGYMSAEIHVIYNNNLTKWPKQCLADLYPLRNVCQENGILYKAELQYFTV